MVPSHETHGKSPAQIHHVVLLAHGSPAPETTLEFNRFAENWALQVPETRVYRAFLSIGSPTLAESLADAMRQGAKHIDVIPLLLFSGKHILVDLPQIATEFMAANPEVAVQIGQPLAQRPGFTAFLADAWLGAEKKGDAQA
jgi:sirohydrochlorin ferrochelatase